MEEMDRLTKFVDGRWIENHDFDERKGWKNGNRACMDKLAAYENTGFEPDEIPTGYELANVFAAMQLLQRFLEIGTPEQFQKLMDAQKNEPLTVEELRQMDGEPVYTVTGLHFPCPNDEWWAILQIIPDADWAHFYGAGKWRSLDFDEYGKTWLAYRRKLEGETE